MDHRLPGRARPRRPEHPPRPAERAGHGEHFGHGLGHGLGLDIHEDPFFSPRASEEDTVEVGMVVTIEPGCYLPEGIGIRLEETALMTENGLVPLTHCPKEPTIP